MYRVALGESYFPAQTDAAVVDTTVGQILLDAAHASPDAAALIEALPDAAMGRHWTYRQLAQDAARLASSLASHFAPGERVAIWAPNCPEWVLPQFAAAMAGLTLVTVNPAYQAKELAYVLGQSRAAGLFLTRTHRGNPMLEIAREVCAGLPAIRRIVDIEDRDALFAMGPDGRGLPAVAPGDPAQIQYTSGTTGFPKGAVLAHRGIVNNARLTLARIGFQPGDAFLSAMPLFHVAGCVLAVLGAIQLRTPMILMRQFDPVAANAIVERERVVMVLGVPTMLIAMLETLAREPRDMSAVKFVVSGGAMVPPELVRRVEATFGCRFGIVYGQTEASGILAQTQVTDSADDQAETTGQALPQTEISIRSVDANAVVPVGMTGEICARGYCTMIGYNDNPEATAKTIDAEGWLHTGDLGTLDARGYLRVTGRVKEMIIRGGENLFPAEIENVLLEHPAVAEVAVVGVPDEKWGEIAVCFLRIAGAHAPTREELVAHCRRSLAGPKTPAHWIVVESFPQTGSGKIQKFVLRETFVAGGYTARL